MNVNQLRERFTKLSIDQLVVLLDQHADEPPVKSRMIEEVLAQKIGVMANEVRREKVGESLEPEFDGRTCPSAINSPSTASFESLKSCKPWAPDHVPAVPSADIVGAVPIHADGTQANRFIGEVVPGLNFVNPGRQEGKVRIPLASEVQKGE